jgi:putative Mn2+ efflux pump MntP
MRRREGVVFSAAFLRIVLLAFSLGLDVFAVCVGVGMRGAGTGVKIRIGAAFAAAEVGMTVLGAGVGRVTGAAFGGTAAYIGFLALAGVGVYMIVEAVRESEGGMDLSRGWGLFTAALSISLDSLGIGFTIVYIGVPFGVSLTVIAVTSIVCSSLGLTLGRFLGRHAEESAGVIAGAVLILTGALFAFLRYRGVG